MQNGPMAVERRPELDADRLAAALADDQGRTVAVVLEQECDRPGDVAARQAADREEAWIDTLSRAPQLEAALRVMVEDPDRRTELMNADPEALEQAMDALGEAPESVREFRVTKPRDVTAGCWTKAVLVSDAGERYTVSAKVYSKPSEHGIHGGLVSKLVVKRDDSETVFSYDRGPAGAFSIHPALVRGIVRRLTRQVTDQLEA